MGLIAVIAIAGKRAVGGVADDPQRREWQPGFLGVGGGDMAFHIDGGSPRLRPQRGLSGAGADHLLDAGKATPDHAAASQCHAGDQFVVEGQTGQPAGIAGQHFGRDHDVA